LIDWISCYPADRLYCIYTNGIQLNGRVVFLITAVGPLASPALFYTVPSPIDHRRDVLHV